MCKLNRLPFVNCLSNLDIPDQEAPDSEFEKCAFNSFEKYKRCLNACIKNAGLCNENSVMSKSGIILTPTKKAFCHNLLITSGWMFIVTRKCSEVMSFGFNSLAFSGEILVKSYEQLELINKYGPINLFASACHEYKNKT